MTILQCCAADAEDHAEQLYDYFPSLHSEFAAAAAHFANISHLHEAVNHLGVTIQNYRSNIFELTTHFTDAKVRYSQNRTIIVMNYSASSPPSSHFHLQIRYFSEHLATETPTMKPMRWIELRMPDGTFAPPPQG